MSYKYRDCTTSNDFEIYNVYIYISLCVVLCGALLWHDICHTNIEIVLHPTTLRYISYIYIYITMCRVVWRATVA